MPELSHQFGEMHRRLKEEGGFTFNPRTGEYPTEGYSVAVHPEAEMKNRDVTEGHLEGYTRGSAPTWSAAGAHEHIGGWHDPDVPEDVIDLPQVFPATGAGHAQAREAMVTHRQKAAFALHSFETEENPFHPGTMKGQQFVEFTHGSPEYQAAQPEVQAWMSSPRGRQSS